MGNTRMTELQAVTHRLFDKLRIYNVVFNIVDDVLYLEHTGLWAAEQNIEERTLAGTFVTKPGYAVGVEIHSPGTDSEPAFSEDCEYGTYKNAQQAAKALALLYYENEINCAMESISDEDYAKQLKEESHA